MNKRLIYLLLMLFLLAAGAAAQANIITNGNFNTGDFTGWWTYCAEPANQSVTIAGGSGYNYDGTSSAKLTSATSTWSAQLGQDFSIGSNVTYNLSFVYSGECPTNSGSAAVAIKYTDASGTDLGVYPWFTLYQQSPAPNTSGQWLTYSGNFTTPANTAHMQLQFQAADWTALHVDNVSVSPVTPTYAIKGCDISTLTTQENFGVKYYECGIQKDLLTILKDHGITLVRIRLFVNPDTSVTGTAMDLTYVKNLAARCKAAGLQVMLDLHYSDTWADPSTQTKPAAWKRLTQANLVTQVYTYTKDVCTQIKPDYVQIGNEITCGMLWPNGEVCTRGNWDNLRALINAGYQGAKEGTGSSAITIIHVSESSGADVHWFFDNLLAGSVSFDAIGLSFYPEILDLAAFTQVNDAAKAYGKGVIICEFADYYSGTGYSEDTQAASLTNALAIDNSLVYWEPAWMWDSTSGYKCLFKPINGNWLNAETTKALSVFGGTPCGGSCTASTMHVASVVCGTKSGSQGKKYGTATVTVQDNCGNPVSGVTVSGAFSGSYNETRSGTTNSSGQVVLTTSTQVKSPAFSFCVNNVSGGSLTYRSQDNIVTCSSY